MHDILHAELTAMAAEDRRVWQQLFEAGEPGEGYAPRMEAVHRKNASRLKQIISEHGWPDRAWLARGGR